MTAASYDADEDEKKRMRMRGTITTRTLMTMATDDDDSHKSDRDSVSSLLFVMPFLQLQLWFTSALLAQRHLRRSMPQGRIPQVHDARHVALPLVNL